MMDPVWFKVESQLPKQSGQPVLVVLLPNPPYRYHREIRTAVYYGPDEWYVHGGVGDHGYYDRSWIEHWTLQPAMPEKAATNG